MNREKNNGRLGLKAIFLLIAAWALVLAGPGASFAQKGVKELIKEGVRIYEDAKKKESIRGLVKAKREYFFRAQQLDPKNPVAKRYIIESGKEILRLRKKKKEERQRVLARARDMKNRGDFYDSVVEYHRLLEMDPENMEANLYLKGNKEKIERYTRRYVDRGIYLIEKGSLDEGFEFLDKVMAVDPENTKANRYRAEKCARILKKADEAYRSGRVEDAEKHLNLAVRFEESEAAARFKRRLAQRRLSKRLLEEAKSQIRASKYLEAKETLLRYQRLNPGGRAEAKLLSDVNAKIAELAGESVARGLKLYQAGRLDKAIKVFSRALMYDPENPTALEYKRRAELKLKALQNM